MTTCCRSIPPSQLAFDIDGVVADTMAMFVRLAHEHYGLKYLTKDHLSCYDIYQCLEIDRGIIQDLVCLTLDDEHTLQISPMPGAVEVLTRLAAYGCLHFVTARIWPESIIQWLQQTLPEVAPERIQVIATGAPEAKLQILRQLEVRYFVEDRLETCQLLVKEGIQPLLFDQPWNRVLPDADFPRVANWAQLGQWVLPDNGN